jgi:lysophospholipase L1-like esterase
LPTEGSSTVLRSDFVASTVAFIARPRHAGRAPDAAVRIAVVGDSLALGTGASRADGGFIFRAFRTLLAQRPGSRIDDVAIGGATVADVLRLEVARLAGIPYDIVIVCAGGNDVVHGTAAADFRITYAHLLKRIAGVTPRARIVCCGVPDVSVSPLFADQRASVRRLAASDDRAVRAAAAATGAAFVDLFAATHGMRDAERFLGRDRFHPSDAGYVILEKALSPVLEQAAR